MIHYICGPFRRETMKLMALSNVTGDTAYVAFDADIIWGKASESVVEIHHGGRLLKGCSTFSDYYGFMTSEKCAIEEAERIAKFYSVTKDSSLKIIVKTTVSDTPYFRSRKCEASDLDNLKIRHQLESTHDLHWRRASDETLLDTIQLSSTIVWDSKELGK